MLHCEFNENWKLEIENFKHMDVNKVIIVGRLTRDPEIRTTPQGVSVTNFGVATNFVYKNQEGQKTEQVEFHNVVAWRKLAEIVGQYMKKGRRVMVEGRLQTRNWEANDGTKRQRTEIVADNVIFLDGRSGEEGGPAPSQNDAPPMPDEEDSSPAVSRPATKKPSDDEISVEDIPF